MSKQPILKVAVSVPLSREFDYLLPAEPVVEPGCRVLVQFGPRRLVGLALDTAAESDYDAGKLRRSALREARLEVSGSSDP